MKDTQVVFMQRCSLFRVSNIRVSYCNIDIWWQVKEKEAELKAAEQRLHDEFEKLRTKNQEEKRLQDDKRRQLVSQETC